MPILSRIFGGKSARRGAAAGDLSLDESILNPPLPEVPEETAEAPKEDWFSETEGLLSRLRRR